MSWICCFVNSVIVAGGCVCIFSSLLVGDSVCLFTCYVWQGLLFTRVVWFL